ncbi:hypothetical protein FEF65_06635 [Mariprofundus erugo]|uniref:Transposase IS200-like domain-containing protein n=1 Tax=Mariprofundus erugo TaxID=2528639 RepID=A0A5R9GMG7_9PROT|nr:transposase [Mariprofundus erugo]TLS67586.1 hypothetical protein FEF65_06635 [Mariprofundus erugo]
MSRPLRIEYPGACYHLTARGDGKDNIFLDDSDRNCFLELLGQEIEQQQWICYAYCLMDNHYHLLVETPEGSLVKGMRRLNGSYTQGFNHRHGYVGHVFQGRYKSIVVEKDAYLLELVRYIALNPVRAGMVEAPEAYIWSSYRSSAGLVASPPWMALQQLMKYFGDEKSYARFVLDGMNTASPWDELHGQIWLGREAFLEQMQRQVPVDGVANIPKVQLQPARPTADGVLGTVAGYFSCDVESVLSRSHRKAYAFSVVLLRRVVNLSVGDVAALFGISVSRVSQIQRELLGSHHANEVAELAEKCRLKN